MEDINKAANVPSVIHMDGPSEPSTEALAALASFIPRTEIINRIINTSIWTEKAANIMKDAQESGPRLKLLYEVISATSVRPIAIQ
ncbi:unnamed protein product [Rhizopus stolonifer]